MPTPLEEKNSTRRVGRRSRRSIRCLVAGRRADQVPHALNVSVVAKAAGDDRPPALRLLQAQLRIVPEPREHFRHCLGLAVDGPVAEGRLKMRRQDRGRAAHQCFRDLDPDRLDRTDGRKAYVGVDLRKEISRREGLRVDDRPGGDGVAEPPLELAGRPHDPDRNPPAVGIRGQKIRPILRPRQGVTRPVASDDDRVVAPTLCADGKLVRFQYRRPVVLMQRQAARAPARIGPVSEALRAPSARPAPSLLVRSRQFPPPGNSSLPRRRAAGG